MDEWDSCTYQVLVKNCSDHSPILTSLASNSLRKVSNFRFFSMWLQDASCMKLIHDSWVNKVVGCLMFILQHKLKRLKIELKIKILLVMFTMQFFLNRVFSLVFNKP